MLRHPRHITYRKVGSMILLHSKISNLEGSTENILSRKCNVHYNMKQYNGLTKMLLEHQISILVWFLKNHVILKTGVTCCKFSFVIIGKNNNKYTCIYISGGPLSALTCCVNVRLLSAIKKISPLIYSQSWVGSWVYTTQAMMTFTLIF